MDLRLKIKGKGAKSSAMDRLSRYSTQPDINGEFDSNSFSSLSQYQKFINNVQPIQETSHSTLLTPVSRLKPQYRITVESSNPGVDGRLTYEKMAAIKKNHRKTNAERPINFGSFSENSKFPCTSTPEPITVRSTSNYELEDYILMKTPDFFASSKSNDLSGRFSSLDQSSSYTNLNQSLNSLTINVDENGRTITQNNTSPIKANDGKKYDNNNNVKTPVKPENRSSTSRLSDVSIGSTSPQSPKKETLVEKTAKCICDRPKTHVLCTICGFTTIGYIRKPCYAHLRVTYLLAMSSCPRCTSGRLMEVTPHDPSNGISNLD